MLIVTVGAVLTAALLVRAAYRGALQPPDLGSMSHQWMAAYQASLPASSI